MFKLFRQYNKNQSLSLLSRLHLHCRLGSKEYQEVERTDMLLVINAEILYSFSDTLAIRQYIAYHAEAAWAVVKRSKLCHCCLFIAVFGRESEKYQEIERTVERTDILEDILQIYRGHVNNRPRQGVDVEKITPVLFTSTADHYVLYCSFKKRWVRAIQIFAG